MPELPYHREREAREIPGHTGEVPLRRILHDFLRGSAPQLAELFTFNDLGPDKSFGPGVICLSLNHISFAGEDGEHRAIWFDGEAFICTDEGTTVQRLHRAGFTVSVPTDTDDVVVSDAAATQSLAA